MDAVNPTLRLKDLITRPDPRARQLLNDTNLSLTFNARGALYELFRAFSLGKDRVVLVPAFHCVSVVEPIVRAGYSVLFYRINENLSIDYDDLEAKLSGGVGALIVINYFGFPAEMTRLLELQKRYKYYIIEDWAHSFLYGKPTRLAGGQGDAVIYSFRKLLPSYAGGGLRINIPDLACKTRSLPVGSVQSIVIIKRLLEQIFENLDDGILKSTFRYCERKRVAGKTHNLEESENGNNRWLDASSVSQDALATASLPWFSKAILDRSNLDAIVSARQRNYQIVQEHLQENAYIRKVFGKLPEEVCPWAFPVLLATREQHDYQLQRIGIPVFTFGDVLHPLIFQCDDRVAAPAKALARNLLLISIHQNLPPANVLSFCHKINGFFSSLAQ